MVASALPPLPIAAAAEAEELVQMCQQLRQCVGACQLSGSATTSGRAESDEPDANITPLQVGQCGALGSKASCVGPGLTCIKLKQMHTLPGKP